MALTLTLDALQAQLTLALGENQKLKDENKRLAAENIALKAEAARLKSECAMNMGMIREEVAKVPYMAPKRRR